MRPQRFRFPLIAALLLLTIAMWPAGAAAQRGPVGHPVGHPGGHQLVIRGGFYGPVYFNPWYGYGYPWYGYGFGFGYGYPYGYGYGYPYGYAYGYPYPPYGYYGAYDPISSSIRLAVTPKNTEVYVDAFLAGTVDDFDGFFQRLRLHPGEHELVLYLDGYRAVHQHVVLSAGADQKVQYTMVPLAAGEQPEARPQPPVRSEEPGYPPPDPTQRGRGGPPPMRVQPPVDIGTPDARFGVIAIRVQPADAEVLIDGERWTGSGGQERLVVQLPEGRHHVEVRKSGFENFTTDVDVSRGQTVPLNVSLLRQSR